MPLVTPSPAAKPGPCILLVEDEPLVARTTVALLRRLRYTVVHADSGEAAWSLLESGMDAFGQLLIDVNMPGCGGVDLVWRVRATRYAGRIVMMSGRLDEDTARALRPLRLDAILAKPFFPEELLAALTPAAAHAVLS